MPGKSYEHLKYTRNCEVCFCFELRPQLTDIGKEINAPFMGVVHIVGGGTLVTNAMSYVSFVKCYLSHCRLINAHR